MEDLSADNPSRICLSEEEINEISKKDLLSRWMEQSKYIDFLESKKKNSGEETEQVAVNVKDPEEKVKQQLMDSTKRENILVMRLTTKEQELQEYVSQLTELKQAQQTNNVQLRSMLLDPAVNLMFQRMKKELEQAKEKMEQTQNELSAWKFTPDSQTGKRLMARCRMLLQENEEMGRINTSGRTATLESQIALQKRLIDDMKNAQQENDDFLVELDEDVEGMQSTIYLLQTQLKESKDQLKQCELLLQQNDISVPLFTNSGNNDEGRTSESETQQDMETSEVILNDGSCERTPSDTTNGAVAMETEVCNKTDSVNDYPSTEEENLDQRTEPVENDAWSPEPYHKHSGEFVSNEDPDSVTNGVNSPVAQDVS